jgi:hypothetical protein
MQLSTNNKGFAPANITEAMTFCEMLASSNMVPKDYIGKPQNILVAIQWGMELGLAPMQSLNSITVINGRPSVWGDALMALVQSSPVYEDVEEYFEDEGTPNPVAVCVATRKGHKPVTSKFSVEDAKRAGLWGKNTWASYPRRMLAHRARGFALRSAFADVLKGMITTEESLDFPDEAKPLPMAKPANPLDMVAPKRVEIPEQTTDTLLIEEAFSQDADAEELAAQDVEVAEVEVTESDVTTKFIPLFVPNKVTPHETFSKLDEWQEAYEDLADKTARAGKVPARERMTILKELKLVNEATLKSIDTVLRARHTTAHLQRLKSLGATI